MIKLAAFIAGFVLTPTLVTLLYNVDVDPRVVLAGVVAVLAYLLVKGGLLRWAALGVVVGYVGFQAIVVWALSNFE